MKTSAGVDPVKYMLLAVIYLPGVKAGVFFIYLIFYLLKWICVYWEKISQACGIARGFKI